MTTNSGGPMQKRIGIDIMGVILPKSIESATYDDFIACNALPHAFESIQKLVNLYHAENIYIISKCPKSAEEVTLAWFDNHDFFAKTGFNRTHAYFCREQADKAQIAQSLKLNYFIDDKTTVLDFMKAVVTHRIQLALNSGLGIATDATGIVSLPDWPSVIKYIIF